MNRKLLSLAKYALLAGILFAAPAAFGYANTPPIDAGYNNRIIDDQIMINSGAMSANDIQNFLNSKVPVCDTNHQGGDPAQPPPYTCLKDYTDPTTGKRAAQLIYDEAQRVGLNPQVILVTLQKEQSLVTDTWPYPSQYKSAMGYGCPESQSVCDSQYYGFYNQVHLGANLLRVGYDRDCGNTSSFPGWSVNSKWARGNSPAVDGVATYLSNCSTGSFYNYTPHRPDSAYTLRGGVYYYGNYNFINFFNSWFGSTWVPSYASSYAGQGAYPAVYPGAPQTTFIQYKNTGNQPWYDDSTAGSFAAQPVHLATSHPLNRFSLVGSAWGGDQNRPASQFSAVYESDGVTLASNQHIVQPGQVAKFNIRFDVAPQLTPGLYQEYFQPIVEGGSSMNDPGTFLNVTVLASYSSAYYRESIYPSIAPGYLATVYIDYSNTGNQNWYDDSSAGSNSAKPIHLATSRPLNRFSAVGTAWGASQNRPTGVLAAVYQSGGATLAPDQHAVQPGQIGRFSFQVFAPTNLSPGMYREYFQPLVEGGSSMNDPGTFIDVTIQSPVYSSAYVGQSDYPVIPKGGTVVSYIKYKNTGNQPWFDDSSASQNTHSTHLATSRALNRFSLVGTWWGGDQNRPTGVFGAVYESDGAALASNQHVAQPGQIVRFDIRFFGPTNIPSKVYREYFQPIVEGLTTMNDPGTFLDVTLQ